MPRLSTITSCPKPGPDLQVKVSTGSEEQVPWICTTIVLVLTLRNLRCGWDYFFFFSLWDGGYASLKKMPCAIWSITPRTTFKLLKLNQLPLLCHYVCMLGCQDLFHRTSCLIASHTTVSLPGKCGHAYVLLPRPTATVLCIMISFCGCADALDVTWSYPFYASSPKQKWDFVQQHKGREWRATSKGSSRRAGGWFATTGFHKCRHLKNMCISTTL